MRPLLEGNLRKLHPATQHRYPFLCRFQPRPRTIRHSRPLLLKHKPGQIRIPDVHGLKSGFGFLVPGLLCFSRGLEVDIKVISRSRESGHPRSEVFANLVSSRQRETHMCEEGNEQGCQCAPDSMMRRESAGSRPGRQGQGEQRRHRLMLYQRSAGVLPASLDCPVRVLPNSLPCASVEPFPTGIFGFDSRSHKIARALAHGFYCLAGGGYYVDLFLKGEVVRSAWEVGFCKTGRGRFGESGWEGYFRGDGWPEIVDKGKKAVFVVCEGREGLVEDGQ